MRDAGVLTDADERYPARGHPQLVEPRDDLDQLQLIVEIGFEPQHIVTVAVGLQNAVALGELLRGPDIRRLLAG